MKVAKLLFLSSLLTPILCLAKELTISALGEPFSEHAIGDPITIQPIGAPSTTIYNHGDPDDYEQLMLELVNIARSDPGAEAARLGIDLNQDLAPGTIEDTPKQPLAFAPTLISSARAHSQWMLDNDVFSHTGESGSSATDRMTDAGYPFGGSWGSGENIAYRATTGTVNIENFTRLSHDGLFISSGHRKNICNDSFEEIGIGIRQGVFTSSGTDWNANMVTQNFAYSGTSPTSALSGAFITGVIYDDADGDDLYDIGEGLAGVYVTPNAGSHSGLSSSSGGYALPVGTASGSITLTLHGWPFHGDTATISMTESRNYKIDFQKADYMDGFNQWQETHFSSANLQDINQEETLWGSAADPDNDGIANLLEYALAGDPNTSDGSSYMPTVATSGGNLTLTYTKQRDDVTYTVEASSTTPDNASFSTTGVTQSPDPSGASTGTPITASIPMSGSHQFLRLKVEMP